MLRSLYTLTIRMGAHHHAIWWLGLISFCESVFLPVPTDAILIPMVLARQQKAWLYAFVAAITSVCGAILAYMIGWYVFELIGQPLFTFYGLAEHVRNFKHNYNAYGSWIVLFGGITPFPYKVITITSGASHLDFRIFLFFSLIARFIRFFSVCALFYWFGSTARYYIDRILDIPSTILFLMTLLVFLLIYIYFL
ncbi:MAG: DedA family protein [Alphaproteobacteria bacterium]|nr:DedA family protein [Alphaproteobacteria bacterium]